MEAFFREAIEKLLKLEKAVGHKGPFSLVEPGQYSTKTLHDVQLTASALGKHIGMQGYLFIIHTEQTKFGQAGEIHLFKGDKNVDITIDMNLSESAKLTTICHEISHKFLDEYASNLNNPLFKNDLEILTDIAAVYLGFGKLMLIGCKESNTVQFPEEVRTTTKTVGYLSKEQLALVAYLWSVLNNIGISRLKLNLDGESQMLLESHHESYEFPSLQGQYELDVMCRDTFSECITPIQKLLAEIARDLTFVQGQLMKKVLKDNELLHNKIYEIQKSFSEINVSSENKPRLSYLLRIHLLQRLKDFSVDFEKLIAGRRRIAENLSVIVTNIIELDNLVTLPTSDWFIKVKCPRDGVVMKFPPEKLLKVTCPHCSYQFMVLTKVPEQTFLRMSEDEQSNNKKKNNRGQPEAKKKGGLLRRIFITENNV